MVGIASHKPLETHSCFISIEGGEGAGKTTVLEVLKKVLLQDSGCEVTCTREPGGTPLAEKIRELVLGVPLIDESLSPETELLLMFASRAQHVRETIRPALERGAWVISDRFTDSSYAYQGGGRGMDSELIVTLEHHVVGLQPGLTILLDLSVDEGHERIRSRDFSDRIAQEKDDFFKRVRAAFLARAAEQPHRFEVIDATQSAQQVAADAIQCLKRLQERNR